MDAVDGCVNLPGLYTQVSGSPDPPASVAGLSREENSKSPKETPPEENKNSCSVFTWLLFVLCPYKTGLSLWRVNVFIWNMKTRPAFPV